MHILDMLPRSQVALLEETKPDWKFMLKSLAKNCKLEYMATSFIMKIQPHPDSEGNALECIHFLAQLTKCVKEQPEHK
jgi:hypothetical protein